MRRALVICVVLVACGSPDEPPPVDVHHVQLAVAPQSITLAPGASQRFTGTVTGTSDRSIRWSADQGTISSDGLYIAPPSEGNFVVTATSVADPLATVRASISVAKPATISVSLEPATARVVSGGQVQFSAVVRNGSNPAVVWSVVESEGGAVDDSGRYTAPPAPGTYHVVAQSREDPTRFAEATVIVSRTAEVEITITPSAVKLATGELQRFTASVTGVDSSDESVVWSVKEAGGGSVDEAGAYTAPDAPGIYRVVARSRAEPEALDEATITVEARTRVTVQISPGSATLRRGASHQFSASVTGTEDVSVSWSADVGTIDPSGRYTAPPHAGTARVQVTSRADPSQYATATVMIAEDAGVVVTIDPLAPDVPVGGAQVFHATVEGTSDSRVTWSVVEREGGEITQDGRYTAPTEARGVFRVVATSVADPSKSAVAQVTVQHEDLLDWGGPVHPTTRVYALWWGDLDAFQPDTRPAMESLLSRIDGTPYLALTDQYLRGEKATVEFAGNLFDPSPPPEDAPMGTVVHEAACNALARAGITAKPGDMVFVYTSNYPYIDPALGEYCAWHDSGVCGGVEIAISYLPNPDGTICTAYPDYGCDSFSAATRSLGVSTAHELLSSITGPFRAAAWHDWKYSEIADKCSHVHGCVGLSGGVDFQLPGMYSNATHGCEL